MPKAIQKAAEKRNEEEQYEESLERLRERLQERQRTLVKIAVIVLVVLAVAVGIFVYQDSAKTKSAQYELEAYRHLAGGNPATAALPAEERVKKALEAFQQAYAARKSPDLLFSIGLCYFDLGQYDEAVKTFQTVGQSSDVRYAGLGHYKTAMVLLKKGDSAKALEALEKVVQLRNAPLQDMALVEMGKILASQGKKEEAQAKYQEVITKFPKSPLAEEAKALLTAQK
jgi:tetratricopeptide (TPR) repeat protein